MNQQICFHEDTKLHQQSAQNCPWKPVKLTHIKPNQHTINPKITKLASFDTADVISHNSLLMAAIVDKSLKIYDLSFPPTSNPIPALQEHSHRPPKCHISHLKSNNVVLLVWDWRSEWIFGALGGFWEWSKSQRSRGFGLNATICDWIGWENWWKMVARGGTRISRMRGQSVNKYKNLTNLGRSYKKIWRVWRGSSKCFYENFR